jgi:hypothetical protein
MSFLPIIFAIVLIWAVVAWLRRRSPPSLSRSPSRSSRSLGSTGGIRRQTERELLRLVNGHRPTALRLVAKVQEYHPGRSEQWCWEKAIYDLQRDRRV